jgi:hypothetical protein
VLIVYLYLLYLCSGGEQSHSQFSLTLMSKGEKRCGLDATVGGLSRIVQPFRVAINAKGGDCWHVLQEECACH